MLYYYIEYRRGHWEVYTMEGQTDWHIKHSPFTIHIKCIVNKYLRTEPFEPFPYYVGNRGHKHFVVDYVVTIILWFCYKGEQAKSWHLWLLHPGLNCALLRQQFLAFPWQKCMGWGELWGTGSGTWQWGHRYRVGLSQEEMCLKNRAKLLLIDRLKNLEGFIYLEVSMKPLIVIRLESNMEVKVHL